MNFALLVCEPHLVPFYQQFSWQPFSGELHVTQRGEKGLFTFNRPMVRQICASAQDHGVIDLMGPPW